MPHLLPAGTPTRRPRSAAGVNRADPHPVPPEGVRIHELCRWPGRDRTARVAARVTRHRHPDHEHVPGAGVWSRRCFHTHRVNLPFWISPRQRAYADLRSNAAGLEDRSLDRRWTSPPPPVSHKSGTPRSCCRPEDLSETAPPSGNVADSGPARDSPARQHHRGQRHSTCVSGCSGLA